ncbi:MAG: hypothetical protein UW99_C0036G0013 [Candidatus Collierbacteria bacterium GW2011_GWC2_45_15]|uniref:Uncharacterized protein n=2 Tax=Candidatus Collieribacteriota TaxID=1752725 RepID=A0A0G1PC07_9BACT|nr:MAG: hypothetical protein UW99_C0036G0013 [Candidatus Collierbacteria bacterium GW2011_GWC2_45_15]KKU30197.1 MAG: hypothetical protein UX41_C0008G0012 [Candidatus Collierbacteria bacterium GW2011_GWE1_46_18]
MNIFNLLVPNAHATIMDDIRQAQPDSYIIQPGTTLAGLFTGGGINLITLAFVIIGLLFMWNIIMAGWDYMMSSGDPKKVSSASTRFLNGFMGIAIAFFAFLIVNIITSMIGLGSLI